MTFQTPYLFSNGHLETIAPHIFRRPTKPNFSRERLELNDGDFLDLDWLQNGNSKVVVLSHGLEGSSNSKYIRGLSDYLSTRGFDILAWNARGCSGETNRLQHMYHSGLSQDLSAVVSSFIDKNSYDEVYLVGFSMGGNITLKYLGEQGSRTHKKIRGAVAVSTPVQLAECADVLAEGFNKVYTWRFLASLYKKLELKSRKQKDFSVDFKKLRRVRNFREFDGIITAPFNGFRDANDYYKQSSSIHVLKDIHIPTLILNALNDPFLSDESYPYQEVGENEFLTMECPEIGGHVGFRQKNTPAYWSEQRIHAHLSLGKE